MSESSQVSPGPLYAGAKPTRDPRYLQYIKSMPCAACLKARWIDPCHTGPHGTGQKACDLTCIPLCRPHHEEFDRSPQKFAERYQLDVPALVEMFRAFYRLKYPAPIAPNERKEAA